MHRSQAGERESIRVYVARKITGNGRKQYNNTQ